MNVCRVEHFWHIHPVTDPRPHQLITHAEHSLCQLYKLFLQLPHIQPVPNIQTVSSSSVCTSQGTQPVPTMKISTGKRSKIYVGLPVKCLLFVFGISQNSYVVTTFSEISQIRKFTKIHLVGVALFHADGQTC